jgi:CO/xanthine dehydrogenase Mo-binding subunit
MLLAAQALEAPLEQVKLEDGCFTVEPGGQDIDFSELARYASDRGEDLRVSGKHEAPRGRPAGVDPGGEVSYCAQVADLTVDPDTGQVSMNRFVSVHDVGTILNPIAHQGQVLGGVVQGLGYALTEELVLEDGRVVNAHFGAYKIPSPADLPEIATVLLETPAGPVPYAGKAIGEVSNCPVAPAVANAVADAAGVRVDSLPVTAEKVHRLMRRETGD